MIKMINLTQHAATAEQVSAGVSDLPAGERQALAAALTFTAAPDAAEIDLRVAAIVTLARQSGQGNAMIGGAGYLLGPLALALYECQIIPYHAFTRREVVENISPDGAVVKTAIFRHAGFVADATAAMAATLLVEVVAVRHV